MLNYIERMVDCYFKLRPRIKPKSINLSQAQLIAHRGAHMEEKGIVENTHAAFMRAFQLGCYGIELDIHETADGVLVVNHDPNLKRLWNNDAFIKDITLETIRDIAPDIPTLEEVVTRYGKKMHLFIELKAPFSAQKKLKAVLEPLIACQDYHLLSLEEGVFKQVADFPKESLLLVAGACNVKQFCQTSLKNQYGGVLAHYLLLTNKKIKSLQQQNQLVGVGFVDSKFSLYREANREMRWIFSNKIDVVKKYLL